MTHYKAIIWVSCFFFVGSSSLWSQDFSLCYERVAGAVGPGGSSIDTIRISLKTTDTQTMALGGMNTSVAYDSTCASVHGYWSLFKIKWGTFLEREAYRPILLDPAYFGYSYNQRLQYGNSYSFFSAGPVILPDSNGPALKVMEIYVSGSCSPLVYIEDESENSYNQWGDVAYNLLSYQMSCRIPLVLNQLEEERVQEEIFSPSVLYPNPAREEIYVAVEPNTDYVFLLLDARGSKIWQQNRTALSPELRFSVENLAPGTYVLQRISFGGESESMRFVKR